MGVFDRLRSLLRANKEPDTESYKEFVSCQDSNRSDIARFKKYIAGYSDRLEQYQTQGVDPGSSMYQDTLSDLQRFQYSLYEAERASKFIRENTVEDIEYRKNYLPLFAEKLKNILPENPCVAFHGTPVYFAEEILKSGKISSTADRFDGYDKSTDGAGQISVSDINSLSRTVNFFLDVSAYQRCLPCGCLFVLDAKEQTEKQRAGSLMNSVDFHKDPEKLLAVISTPENLERVQGWLKNAGLSADLACTFDGFVKELNLDRQEPVLATAPRKTLEAQINCAQAQVSRSDDYIAPVFYTR